MTKRSTKKNCAAQQVKASDVLPWQGCLNQLIDELGAAEEVFARNKQKGAFHALIAVNFFLRGVDAPGVRVFDALTDALIDAQNGLKNEIIKPKNIPTRSRRTKKNIAEERKWGEAAAVVTLLHKAGWSRSKALNAVAKALDRNNSAVMKGKLQSLRSNIYRRTAATKKTMFYDSAVAARSKIKVDAAIVDKWLNAIQRK